MSDFRSMQDMFNGTVDGSVNRQPTPLFLADALNADARSSEIKLQAASELRRLYGLCIQLEEELNAKPQRTWVGLTDEQIHKASTQAGMQEHYMGFHSGFIRFARAIEAKLKEKNNPLQSEQEHNFCPRCGKRNKDIHTCTPPQD